MRATPWHFALLLAAAIFSSTLSSPVRTAQKSKPIRAPLSSISSYHPIDNQDIANLPTFDHSQRQPIRDTLGLTQWNRKRPRTQQEEPQLRVKSRIASELTDAGPSSSRIEMKAKGPSRSSRTAQGKMERGAAFDRALEAHQLSVLDQSPRDFLLGVKSMKIDGDITATSRALFAKKHVMNHAPSEAYKNEYLEQVDLLANENAVAAKRLVRQQRKKEQEAASAASAAQASTTPTTQTTNRSQILLRKGMVIGKDVAHRARDQRKLDRLNRVIKELENKGYDLSLPMVDLEKNVRGACLDNVDATTCSRMILQYIRITKGEDAWKKLGKLKSTASSVSSRKRLRDEMKRKRVVGHESESENK